MQYKILYHFLAVILSIYLACLCKILYHAIVVLCSAVFGLAIILLMQGDGCLLGECPVLHYCVLIQQQQQFDLGCRFYQKTNLTEASTAVYSKAVVLLLLIRCLLCLHCLWCSILCCFLLNNHQSGEKRAGNFTLFDV